MLEYGNSQSTPHERFEDCNSPNLIMNEEHMLGTGDDR